MNKALRQTEVAKVDAAAFTQFDPVPPEGIKRATEAMESGRMFRYCGEGPQDSEVALLEREFADYLGVNYALGVTSCSAAIKAALKLLNIHAGVKVLLPGFTFSAVPSAVELQQAHSIFVECDRNYKMDVRDFHRKVEEHPDAKVLLLSHMRGHICDMDAVMEICKANDITMIEDAAHALGVRWKEKMVGSFGVIGCFSSQSNKIINSGEGGVLVTNDVEMYAKAILLSGAYEKNREKHFFREGDDVDRYFRKYANLIPLDNLRMSNVTAAILRPQLKLIDKKAERYREMYAYVKGQLSRGNAVVELPEESEHEARIPDSIQLRLIGFSPPQMRAFIACMKRIGFPIAGFVEEGNARHFQNWKFAMTPHLPMTRDALATACDMRWPATLEKRHLDFFIEAVHEAIREAESQT